MASRARECCPTRVTDYAGGQNEGFPQPCSQRREGSVDDDLGGLSMAAPFQLLLQSRSRKVRQPVDSNWKVVIQSVQRPGAPGREPQNARSTKARVGEQHGTTFPEMQTRDRYFHQRYRDSRQLSR